MVKLKRVVKFNLNPYFESKQDEERLKEYLGDDLFNQYMDVRKKLPNLSNQFKDFTKISFDTGNSDKDNEIKKDLVNSYNRLIKYLPKNKQSLFKQRDINNFSRLGGKTLETLLDKYKEARDIVFKDQARFRDFGQLSKIPVAEIQDWVDTFSTNRAKRQQDKIGGADKIYEDSDWVVYRIITYPAAQLYGSNTKWCITGRYPGHEGIGEKYFNDYIRDNNLDGGYYFYISKKDPSEKYCVLQRKDKTIHSIWDASDTNRGSNYDDLGVDLPEVKEVNISKYTIDDLTHAIKDGDINKVKEYINKGFDLNGKDKLGNTPLQTASSYGYIGIVELLLVNGADPDFGFYSPLYLASERGYTDIVELLLRYGSDPNLKTPNDEFPLVTATYNKKSDIVKLLLEYDANPNVKEFHSSLFYALRENYTDIVELLLKHGANPNIRETPNLLLLAIGHENKNLVELLLNHGADPNVKDDSGNTPLSYAFSKGYKDIVELLKKYGARE